jgi:hypothetical protein
MKPKNELQNTEMLNMILTLTVKAVAYDAIKYSQQYPN